MRRIFALLLALTLALGALPIGVAASPAPDDALAVAAYSTEAPPVTTPEAGSALIEQAVGYLLDGYVDRPKSGPLYQAAYDGAVAALRAAGKSPQPQPPALADDRQRDTAAFRAAYLALLAPLGAGVDQAAVAYGAIRAVAKTIDECHTYFLDPEQNARAKASATGQESYVGIGVTVNAKLTPPTIARVYRNTPAERAGLRAGDAILAVDGTDVSGLPADQLGPLIRGPEGTQVRLTIRRPGQAAPFDVTIARARITIPILEERIETGPNGEPIGYLELTSFAATLADGTAVDAAIGAALARFERAGVRGWVLDLRGNPGGLIETLRRTASRFIPDGQPVFYYVDSDGAQRAVNADRALYLTQQRPFAVLIDDGSASASEAFAAAAQDYGFARVFGKTSTGCLAAAIRRDLADGSALSVTVQKVVSPKRREINRAGVQPDEAVTPDPAQAGDPTLRAALAWLVAQRQPGAAPSPVPSPVPSPAPSAAPLPGLPATGGGGAARGAPSPAPALPLGGLLVAVGWGVRRRRRA